MVDSVDRSLYPDADSIVRLARDLDPPPSSALPSAVALAGKGAGGVGRGEEPGGGGGAWCAECVDRQCEWLMFDHRLILPEFVIDIEYVTAVSMPTVVMSCHRDLHI